MTTTPAPSDLHLELEQLQSQFRGLQQKLVDSEGQYRNLDPDSLDTDTFGESIDGPGAHAAVLTRLDVLRAALDTAAEALDETLPYSRRLKLG